MSAVKVLLVIYDEPARQALRSMLTEASNVEVAGEAASVVEALLQVDNTSPDVVLVDAEVHGVSGVEMIRLLKDSGYDWPVVALGANVDSLEEAMSAGALGFATWECPDEELVDIIGRVSEGEFAFGPSVMETPRGMRIALHYMTGQAGADVAPASSPVPVDEAKGAFQDVAVPLHSEPAGEDAVEPGLGSTLADAGADAVGAGLDSTLADAGEDTVGAGLDSTPADAGEVAVEAGLDSALTDAGGDTVGAGPDSTLADAGDDAVQAALDSTLADAGGDAVEAALDSTLANAGETTTPSIELVISSPAKMDSVVKLYQWLHDLPEAEVTGVVRPSTGDTVVTVKIIRPILMAEMLMALKVVSEVISEPSPEGSGVSTRLRLILNGG